MRRSNRRTLRSYVVAVFSLFAAGLLAATARAQIAPGDTGAGVQLGMQQLGNSGQAGTVTLFERGENTLVTISVVSEPPGRREAARIHRGRGCKDFDPGPAFSLAPAVNGTSRTIVRSLETKLLSGNYVVVLHADDAKLDHFVSCGHLYR